jgi:hypothetical protein
MLSVLFLKAPTYETSQIVSQHNPNAFYYSFEFEGRNSLNDYSFSRNPVPVPHGIRLLAVPFFSRIKTLSIYYLDPGVAHADEMIYLFVFPFPSIPPGLNAAEEELSKKMLQVWTNFVIYG